MSNPCLEAVIAELDKVGVPHRVEHGGKHLRVVYGEKFDYVQIIAATPSDWRAPLNERAAIRRSLAQLGLTKPSAHMPNDVKLSLSSGKATCASYDIADSFSKAHKDVLRAIDNIRESCGDEFDQRNFAPIDYVDAKGRKYRAYRMTRDGFTLVAMGFTGSAAMEWKLKYIQAFNAMESEIAALAGGQCSYVSQADFDALVELMSALPVPALDAPKRGRSFIPASIPARQAARKAARRRLDDWQQKPHHW